MRSFLFQKRATALGGAAVVVAALMAGCGGGSSSLDPGTGTDGGDTNARKQIIVFAGANGLYSVQSGGTSQKR